MAILIFLFLLTFDKIACIINMYDISLSNYHFFHDDIIFWFKYIKITIIFQKAVL